MAVFQKTAIVFLLCFFLVSPIPSFAAVPFVILYGLGESCSTPRVENLTEHLSNRSGIQGYCIETVAEGWDWETWITPLMKQVDIACSKVKSIPALDEGYNMVALSQGNLVGRGIVELCDGAPPVKKFIGLAGPHAGIASIPYCRSEVICSFVDYLLQEGIYSDFIQNNLAPSNFVRVPTDLEEYLKDCKFLPLLNNEIAAKRNSTYKERFSSLEKLVLVMFENDTVLVPRETSWFGYFKDGSMSTVLPYNETQLYTEDWFGLKTLDEAGKIEFISVPGEHLEINESVENRIIPYLKAEKLTQGRAQRSSFGTSMASIWKSIAELFTSK